MKTWMWILAAIAVVLVVVLLRTGTREGFDPPPPTCPDGYSINDDSTSCRKEVPSTCPPGYTAGSNACSMVTPEGKRVGAENICPEGTIKGSTTCAYPAISPICPSGYRYERVPVGGSLRSTSKCVSNTETQARNETRAQPSSGGAAADPSITSGTTTGGSSDSSLGPNSGGGGSRRKQVFGPISSGKGDGGPVPNDSSKSNQYPELLGGDGGRASTRIEGGGIVNPSGEGITLPPSSSLGSDENSKYLPFSRQPGDMEKIPDPYRVSQQFSASNYSFKTEPVPFLTDFSAFQK